jgi:hypothetical protein
MEQKKKARVIAFYLPQYHPIPENDEWWGKGFTEWTNVGRAKPLFRGHYQPRVPADLGYYDLRVPEVREQQAQMAKDAGIEGFCYWHYWFGNRKTLLERPFQEVLSSGKPDFPFCLGWANESWRAKVWNSVDTTKDKVLIKQLYLGNEDDTLHFNELLPAFKDKRYIKIDDKPIFFIYQPNNHPYIKEFIERWNNLAKENGFNDGLFFIGRITFEEHMDFLLEQGFSSILLERFKLGRYTSIIDNVKTAFINSIRRRPLRTFLYKDAIKSFTNSQINSKETAFPVIIPNWDHSPRSGRSGVILHGNSPQFFRKHIREIFDIIKNKKDSRKIVFLKSWNEWAEGNYIEPDLKYGRDYLEVLRDELNR